MFLLIQNPEVNSSYYFTYFTFHNVSINTENPDVSGVDFQNFTFHDVSINTLSSTHSKSRVVPLHSTMLLLIQIIRCMKLMLIASLHSTMFLLIPGFCVRLRIQKNALHSTMFLLILQAIVDLIKTFSSLHSTMFLLIQSSNLVFSSCRICFTFHDVSINT